MSDSQYHHSYDKPQYHILNGDALKQQFPQSIDGEIIVARECLVDGNVQGNDFESLMNNRSKFIGQYPECTAEDYYVKTVTEFKKIIALNHNCHINCWFEDDLFCQVNFWYVLFLVSQQSNECERGIYLVRPNKGNEYSFGHMSLPELTAAFQNRRLILPEHLAVLGQLWPNYQKNNHSKLSQIAESLKGEFPFLLPAVNAHIARTPDESGLGYPERVLLEIINAQEQPSFKTVFRVFHQQMAIYSFGDLQVKAMYDRLMNI
ncbi:hypothetical protein Q4493_09185 [Colwellia sp. 1_MG-2023]|uniref:hypothetical protein n=1 Tax=Colwellia sp. 1_MG-2023 TaxID=3062649 RepID=UPI0026E22122|nr:hypothetical protein [Colwellia sp. 1_MG-2023]MDO6445944.1 hypothetical protein [Colwellia sp. 1_MG-2023]